MIIRKNNYYVRLGKSAVDGEANSRLIEMTNVVKSIHLNWKSDYKLPVSFILFFVLTFFLIGEQLPALPTYLGFGPGLESGGKIRILDLNLTDSLHRPAVYVIIGTVIWILFRIFSWPIAWLIGAALWALEQLTLTQLDQRPSLAGVLFFTFTFWILLTLVPYFIYRAVDRKWGRKGRRNVILTVLAINILLLAFFAYQIFYLQNSYLGLQAISSGSIPGLPPNICPDRLIIEKNKQTTAYWGGKILPVSGEVQNWVEENCPGVVERIEQPT